MSTFSVLSGAFFIILTLLSAAGIVMTRANSQKFSISVFALSVLLVATSAVYQSITGKDLLLEYVVDPLVQRFGIETASMTKDPASLNEEGPINRPAVEKNMWTVVSQPLLPNSYNSDLILSQTPVQIGFVCNPRALNIQVIFQARYPEKTMFERRFAGQNITKLRIYFVFLDSGRIVPLDFTRMTNQGADISYVADYQNVSSFQTESAEVILRRAVLQEERFHLSIEKGGETWTSGYYMMEGVKRVWDDANLGRTGPAVSASSICNSYSKI